MGDLRSQMAACTLGRAPPRGTLRALRRETIAAAIERIFDETEAQVPAGRRARSPTAPTKPNRSWTTTASIARRRVPIRVRVVVSGTDLTIDLTKCSLERRGAINARTLAGAYIAYKGITGPLEPVNEGSFRALKVEIQEGNIMMARFPAPMAGWSRAAADRRRYDHQGARAGACPTHSGRAYGHARRRHRVLRPRSGAPAATSCCKRSKAAAGARGRGKTANRPSVSVCQGDVRNAPIETIELKTPVRVERRALRDGSGGAGKFRGGLGHDRRRSPISPKAAGASATADAASCRRGACGAAKQRRTRRAITCAAPARRSFATRTRIRDADAGRLERHRRNGRRRRLGRSARARSAAGPQRRPRGVHLARRGARGLRRRALRADDDRRARRRWRCARAAARRTEAPDGRRGGRSARAARACASRAARARAGRPCHLLRRSAQHAAHGSSHVSHRLAYARSGGADRPGREAAPSCCSRRCGTPSARAKRPATCASRR